MVKAHIVWIELNSLPMPWPIIEEQLHLLRVEVGPGALEMIAHELPGKAFAFVRFQESN